jgi:hypothetical protein
MSRLRRAEDKPDKGLGSPHIQRGHPEAPQRTSSTDDGGCFQIAAMLLLFPLGGLIGLVLFFFVVFVVPTVVVQWIQTGLQQPLGRGIAGLTFIIAALVILLAVLIRWRRGHADHRIVGLASAVVLAIVGLVVVWAAVIETSSPPGVLAPPGIELSAVLGRFSLRRGDQTLGFVAREAAAEFETAKRSGPVGLIDPFGR